METTITGITAGQVHDRLARVLPHVGDDDTLPMLIRVQITIGDGHLLAAATDRFTLAVAHLPATPGTLTLNPAAPTVLTAVSTGPGLLPLTVHSAGGHCPLVLLGPGFLGLLAILKTRPDQPTPTPARIDPDGWRATWADLLTADRTPVPA